MLVLSRRVSEQIKIGANITITVTSIDGSRVKLGIDAPRDVRIDRMEVCEARKQETLQTPLARFGGRIRGGRVKVAG